MNRRSQTKVIGTVYLIHFAEPYQHARHYLGWTSDLDARIVEHARGAGARLMEVIVAAGIEWRVVRTWTGDRHLERRLKQHGKARICPECLEECRLNRPEIAPR